ncbi:phospholipid phosphatase [Photobacterium jeanii]|uniref:undecaprenyl-diphosphate phosphatase n=1 Tax=Photobacterium jeanii TaxID=858640 RepID=A0A178KL97_9GAMM|nr:phosphatase PAP2 family protein [Photobacterium jeanii]OAN17765.1 phospholipid phosphatase [Photobacterium jeanii]PST92570.1 phosphatase PAP2 family protein [Photobacterium jeanii]
MLRLLFSRKAPGYLALCGFAIPLGFLLSLIPSPDLMSPASDSLGLLFTLLSDSAGNPWFLVTVSALCLLPLLFKQNKKVCLMLWCQFALLLVLSFAAKTVMKQLTEVPRPYTHQLAAMELVESAPAFYQLSATEKETVIEQAQQDVSPWRIRHWEGETNYSLPSGHTIFAAVCILFWGGFCLRNKHYVTFSLLIIWGLGVAFSRIWLGMHWPSDLMMSTASAALLYLLVPEPNAVYLRRKTIMQNYQALYKQGREQSK